MGAQSETVGSVPMTALSQSDLEAQYCRGEMTSEADALIAAHSTWPRLRFARSVTKSFCCWSESSLATLKARLGVAGLIPSSRARTCDCNIASVLLNSGRREEELCPAWRGTNTPSSIGYAVKDRRPAHS